MMNRTQANIIRNERIHTIEADSVEKSNDNGLNGSTMRQNVSALQSKLRDSMEAIQEFDVNNNCAFYSFINHSSHANGANGKIKITAGG